MDILLGKAFDDELKAARYAASDYARRYLRPFTITKTEEKTEEKKPISPKVVMDWIQKKSEEMELSGQYTAAAIRRFENETIDQYITQPRIEAEKAERLKEKTDREASESKAAREQEVQRNAASLRASVAKAAKDYGNLWVKDTKFSVGYRCTDPAVAQHVAKLVDAGYGADEATTMALVKLGRHLTPGTTAKKATTQPPVQNVRVAKKEHVDKKYFVED